MHGQESNLLRAGLMQELAAGVAFTIAFTAVSVWAQSVSGLSGGPGQTSLPSANEGVPITDIEVEFEGTGAQGDRLDEIRRLVLRMLGLRIGDGWDQLLAEGAMAKLTTLRNVRTAQYRLVRQINPDGVKVIVRITLEVEREKKPATGVLVTGMLSAFPILYQDDCRMFRILLNGGIGVFTDGNPWFDSPKTFTAGNPHIEKAANGCTGRALPHLESGFCSG